MSVHLILKTIMLGSFQAHFIDAETGLSVCLVYQWQSGNLNSGKSGSKSVLLILYHFIQRIEFHQFCFSGQSIHDSSPSSAYSIFTCMYSIPGTVSSYGTYKDALDINHHNKISNL